MGRLFLVLGCAIAIVLMADSIMHDPNVHPVASSLVDHIGDGVDGLASRFGSDNGDLPDEAGKHAAP